MECYTEYVNRALRFYARNPVPEFRTKADRLNWQAVHVALSGLEEEQKQAVLCVFAAKGRLPDNVMRYQNLPPHTVWKTIAGVSKAVAKGRGLI